MKVFIVHAHPEPKSFNGALTRTAIETLGGAGHEVKVSDLYAMGWDPVSGPHNFKSRAEPGYFKQQVEETHAAATGGFVPEIQAEIDKLFWCDALILQFPLWWFSVPAIMKGWVDRVFASGGVVYGGGKWYDNGTMRGKRAMLSLTTGGPETIYSETGLNGHIDALLYPLNHGILRFVGFDVLPPFVAWAPTRVSDEDRRRMLDAYRARLLDWERATPIAYPRLADHDETLRRKS
jgi:NAD(P)H dehydrogenase (quinone)